MDGFLHSMRDQVEDSDEQFSYVMLAGVVSCVMCGSCVSHTVKYA